MEDSNLKLKENKGPSWVALIFLVILVISVIVIIIIISKENKTSKKQEKNKKLEIIEKQSFPKLSKKTTFRAISTISFNEKIYVGIDNDERYYLLDLDNNIIDQSDDQILYLGYGFYYKWQNKEQKMKLFKESKPISHVAEDENVLIYKNNENTFPHYYFESHDISQYYSEKIKETSSLIFDLLRNFASYYIEELNLFVYYNYNEDTNTTRVLKYDTKTGKFLDSKTFDGKLGKIRETVDISIGEKVTNLNEETILYNKKNLYFSCKSDECKSSVVDIETMKTIFPNSYDVIFDFDEKYYVVKQNKKYGVVDGKGTIIIPLEYDNISRDENYKSFIVTKGDKKGILDLNNNVILELKNYQSVATLNDYIGMALNNTWAKVIKNNKEIINYKNNKHPNNDLILNFYSYPFEPYKEYTYLVLSWFAGCDEYNQLCGYKDEKIEYIIYGDKIIENVDNYYEFYEPYIIEDKYVKNKKYLVVTSSFDKYLTTIYDEELNLIFQYEGEEFNKITQVNKDYLLFKTGNNEELNLYFNIKEKKIETESDFKIKHDNIPYGVNNPLNEKYFIKVNENGMGIYDLNKKPLKVLKDVEKITHIEEDYYVVQTSSKQMKIVQFKF